MLREEAACWAGEEVASTQQESHNSSFWKTLRKVRPEPALGGSPHIIWSDSGERQLRVPGLVKDIRLGSKLAQEKNPSVFPDRKDASYGQEGGGGGLRKPEDAHDQA